MLKVQIVTEKTPLNIIIISCSLAIDERQEYFERSEYQYNQIHNADKIN